MVAHVLCRQAICECVNIYFQEAMGRFGVPFRINVYVKDRRCKGRVMAGGCAEHVIHLRIVFKIHSSVVFSHCNLNPGHF